MVIVKNVRWMNFLGTGNSFMEIELDKSKTTFLFGSNGSGKSTMMDALSFGLFNKAFRKVNKNQLINTITNKNTVVEVDFTANKKSYLVRRGMKPNIFEIYQNGVLLNPPSANKDYQEYLERNILKINHKTFCQIVVIGAANFVPFMRLPAAHRRELVESILDIQVFGVMNTKLKEIISENKEELINIENEIKIVENSINIKVQHNDDLRRGIEDETNKKNDNVLKILEDNSKYEKEILKNNVLIAKTKENIDKTKTKLDVKIEAAYKEKSSVDSNIIKYTKDLNFFENHSDCPTCHQKMNEEFKDDKKEEFKKDIEKYKKLLSGVLTKISDLQEKQKGLNDIVNKYNKLVNKNSILTTNISNNNKQVSALQKDIEQLVNKKYIDLSSEKQLLSDYIDKKRVLLENREINTLASLLLKDSGIKSQIIKQYINTMNKLINKYLEKLDFFCKFEMNENFEETIKSRHRDIFTYESFSEGEKLRIDLALLFAWREITKIRNSSSINLLVLDEIMDSSLDSDGTEEFIKIIKQISKNNNIIIISHKNEQMIDKFDQSIKFSKEKNFSKMEKAA